MLSKLFQLFKRGGRTLKRRPKLDDESDFSWLDPPANLADVAAWDLYWTAQIKHGLGPPLFDMFSDDRSLVQTMNREGMKSVLCAGNGISQEPKALAMAGFQVVALDISPQATEIARRFEFPANAFDVFCDPEMRRPGGSVDFFVGDVLEPAVCPGPFDLIIERRTAQLFYCHDIGSLLGALTKRLGPNGIFFSHCHDGGWKPPNKPRHFTTFWFLNNRWTIWNGGPGAKPPGRVAWFFTSTG